MPIGVSNQIESLCKSFLWSGKENGRRRRFPVAWSVVTLPFEEGGLDIKEVLVWNKTVFLKLGADLILGRDNIWTEWVKCNITRGRDIWEVQIHANDSWTRKTTLGLGSASRVQDFVLPSCWLGN